MVSRVERVARGLIRVATLAAFAGGPAGLVLWWSTSGRQVDDGGQDTALSLLVLALCLVPAGWLLNVRVSLLALVALPATLGGVTTRRGTQLLGTAGSRSPVPERRIGGLAAVRSLRSVLRDYGDVTGSWATVVQLVTPTFWTATFLALLAVPVLVAVATVSVLLEALA